MHNRVKALKRHWRCSGRHPDTNKKCLALIGVMNQDDNGIFIRRRDLKVYVYDLGATGIMLECRTCGTENWLFSKGLDGALIEETKSNHQKGTFNLHKSPTDC